MNTTGLVKVIALTLGIAICLACLTLALALDRPILKDLKGIVQGSQCCPEVVEADNTCCPADETVELVSEECCPET